VLRWACSVALIVVPAATAEFDYRYVLTATPFACLAAALAFGRDAAGGRWLALRRRAATAASAAPGASAPVGPIPAGPPPKSDVSDVPGVGLVSGAPGAPAARRASRAASRAAALTAARPTPAT